MKNSSQDVLEAASRWLKEGRSVELVTVLRTWGSSPRPIGAIAAIREDGVIVGSVSGGCIETQLSERFKGEAVPHVHTHRIDDQEAKRFGLACGGELELLFETLDPDSKIDAVLDHLGRRERVVRRLSTTTNQVSINPAEAGDVFSWQSPELKQVFGPSWQLLIVGVDPRDKFFASWDIDEVPIVSISPDDAVLQYASDSNSAVLALSHDPNIDDLALMEALPSQAFYVGALGSTRNYEKRCKRLLGLDVPQHSIDRLRGPVGLSIGARGSAEIAVSIVAELIQVRQPFI